MFSILAQSFAPKKLCQVQILAKPDKRPGFRKWSNQKKFSWAVWKEFWWSLVCVL